MKKLITILLLIFIDLITRSAGAAMICNYFGSLEDSGVPDCMAVTIDNPYVFTYEGASLVVRNNNSFSATVSHTDSDGTVHNYTMIMHIAEDGQPYSVVHYQKNRRKELCLFQDIFGRCIYIYETVCDKRKADSHEEEIAVDIDCVH